MSILAIRNIGTLVSGDLATGILDADTILCSGGVISHIGKGLDVSKADVVVDAKGTTVIPGLIDSHCHVVLCDYTPRQRTVGFLESYTHGGITSVISPGEIKTVCEIASLTGLSPEKTVALATGNNARAYNPRSGVIAEGHEADLVVMDVPWGSSGQRCVGCHRQRRYSRYFCRHHRRQGAHAEKP